jgi:hypothetical protein
MAHLPELAVSNSFLHPVDSPRFDKERQLTHKVETLALALPISSTALPIGIIHR